MTIDELIRAVDLADTPAKMVAAVQNLAAVKDVAAIPSLIAVFGYNNPAAASLAVAALTELGEQAVPQLLNLDDYNYGARAYSIRTLAAIADPRALDVLITGAATDFAPSVRRAAAKGLGNLRYGKLPFHHRRKAWEKAWETLLLVSLDSEWSIRYAAVVGLQALAKLPDLQEPIYTRLKEMLAMDTENVIRARVQLAVANNNSHKTR